MANYRYDFNGKVAVVTGGSGAIGKGIVKRFVEFGAKVAVIDIMAPDGLDVPPYKDNTQFFKTDITSSEKVKETIDQIIAWTGKIDFLVNTAGVCKRGTMEEFSDADYDLSMNVNVKGMYLMTKMVSHYMKKQQGGKIVNFASTGGVAGFPTTPVYCASKGAVVMLTKANALELAPFGINVNAVSPNAVDNTPMMAAALAIPGERERRAAKVPLGRMVQAEDIIGPVMFLCSEAADMMTGSNLYVDGGFLA